MPSPGTSAEYVHSGGAYAGGVDRLSSRMDLIQRSDGAERRIPLRPGQAVVNRMGVWHTVDAHEPGDALFITPGQGTEHEPRTD
jgi:hypothetical protein